MLRAMGAQYRIIGCKGTKKNAKYIKHGCILRFFNIVAGVSFQVVLSTVPCLYGLVM